MKLMMKKIICITFIMSSIWAVAVYGQSADMAWGQITNIDKAANKVTIRHGEIKNLNMPPMRMVFQVRDPALLEKLKLHQTVKFSAIEEKGVYIVTALEPDAP